MEIGSETKVLVFQLWAYVANQILVQTGVEATEPGSGHPKGSADVYR